MSFTTYLTKIQFKLDHVPFLNRVAVLGGVLFVMLMLWLLLIYFPQAEQAAGIHEQIRQLENQNMRLFQRNERMLRHIKTHDMDSLIEQHQQLRAEEQALEQEIKGYRYRYIDDKALAALLHAILKDMKNLKIENFSTLVQTKTLVKAASSSVDTKTKAALPEKLGPINPHAAPEETRYSLSLRGDYFSILKFLKRVEGLKWQLFWDKFTYHVEKYPEGIATLEFYTLKAGGAV